MANLKAEFHEHLTRPRGVKYDEEMNICLLESRLEMSKSHANMVSFDENVSYLLTSMNLYERNEHFVGSFCRYRSTDYVSLRKTKEIKDRKQNNSK